MRKISETFLLVVFGIAFTTSVVLLPFEIYKVLSKLTKTYYLFLGSFLLSIILGLILGFFKKN
jgi:hypothetical protein